MSECKGNLRVPDELSLFARRQAPHVRLERDSPKNDASGDVRSRASHARDGRRRSEWFEFGFGFAFASLCDARKSDGWMGGSVRTIDGDDGDKTRVGW